MNPRHTRRPNPGAYPTAAPTGLLADTSPAVAATRFTNTAPNIEPNSAGGVADRQTAYQLRPTTHAARMQARIESDAHRVCPGCGTQMVDRGCKLRCARCGFFLDCSDG